MRSTNRLLLLLLLLLLRGSHWNSVTAVVIEDTLMTPLTECLNCDDVSIPLDAEPALDR